jgi:hypothetical protein
MKTGMKPVLFAGRQEYKQDLSTLRETVKPLCRQLSSDMAADWASIRLSNIEARKDILTDGKQAVQKPLSYGARMLWLKSGQLSVTIIGMLLTRALLASDENPEVSQPKNKGKLVTTVQRLREETDPAKSGWLQEFEKESGRLNRIERFTLTRWDWRV